MTPAQAKRILDQLKFGDADYSDSVIRQALIASGDLSDAPQQGGVWQRPWPGWIDLARDRK